MEGGPILDMTCQDLHAPPPPAPAQILADCLAPWLQTHPSMNGMTKKTSALVLCLGVLASVSVAGCGPDLCGDHYHDGYAPRCETAGAAKLVAPAHLGLPGSVSANSGASCLDDQGGCTTTPYLTFDSNPSDDGSVPRPAISVQLFFTQAMDVGTYAITPESYEVLINAQVFMSATTRESLDVVDGTITVQSSSPERLGAAISLTFRLPSTGETLTFASTTASASCELESVRICDDPLDVPYGQI